MTSSQAAPEQALHKLYSDHNGWLRNWLQRKLGCPQSAADLAQDTFLKVLLGREAHRILEPRAFLTTIAKRVLANHYRRQQLERAYLEALAMLSPTLVTSPEERALVFEALDEIDRMLDGLAAPVRQAFLMSQLDGMKQAEIAQALGISQTTVKRYLVQAGLACFTAVGA